MTDDLISVTPDEYFVQRSNGVNLMDRNALAQWTLRSVRTIRDHCVPVCYHPGNGRALYDADACAKILDAVPQRGRVAC